MDGDKYYIHCTVLEIDLVCVRESWNPSLFDQNYNLAKYYGTDLFWGYNHLQLFYKFLLNICKVCSDEQNNNMVRILEIDRKLSGFNITIYLYFTSRCVDKFITESEIQMALTVPANQTTRDSSKWHPANETRWDKQELHSADRHVMADRNQVEMGHLATKIRIFLVGLTYFHLN